MGAGVLAVPASAATGVHASLRAETSGTARAASPILVSGASSWGFKDTWTQYVTRFGGAVGGQGGGASADTAGKVTYPVEHGTVDAAGYSPTYGSADRSPTRCPPTTSPASPSPTLGSSRTAGARSTWT
ncbi:hypothetical protein SCALM49S_09596 [Streptomyces californicus]